MKVFFLLIIMNLKEILRDLKRNLLFFFLPMAIFIGFITFYQYNKVELSFIKPINVGVVVLEESIYGQMLVDDFGSKKDFSNFFKLTQGDPLSVYTLFEEKKLDALVTIPQGFVKSLMNFNYLPIEVKMHRDDPIKTVILYHGFRSYERYIQSVEKSITAFYDGYYSKADHETYWEYNNALSIELIMTVLQRNELFSLEKIVDIPSVLSMDYYFISLSILFILYFAMAQAVALIIERNQHVFHRLMTTRVSIAQYFIVKISVMATVLSFYLWLWTYIYSFLTVQPFFYQFKIFIIMVLCITITIEIAIIATSLVRNTQEYFMTMSMFIFFNGIVGGSIIPIHYMPNSLKEIAQWTPSFQWIKYLLFLKNDLWIKNNNFIASGLVVIIIALFFSIVIVNKRLLTRGGIG